MMTLTDIVKPGLAGWSRRDGRSFVPLLDDADVELWRSACEVRVGRLNGRVTAFEERDAGRNYHRIIVTPIAHPKREPPYVILLHSILRYVAAGRLKKAVEIGEGSDAFDPAHLVYIKCPLLDRDLPDSFVRLTPELLNSRLVLEPWMEAPIGRVAYKEMREHPPERVGDLVFNWYNSY